MLFENLSEKMSNIFKKLRKKGKLTESDVNLAVREIKLALLEADVSYTVVKSFVDSIVKKAVGSEIFNSLTPDQQVIKIVQEELENLMENKEKSNEIKFPSNLPCIILMCGLQGSGKTTQSVKLAKYYAKKGHRPLIAACDVYRPAAIEQLKVLAKTASIEVFEMGQDDPLKIANEALKYSKDHGHDLLIVDTAGRLHIDEKLMNELEGLKKNLNVSETLFVVDAMSGQDVINVAKTFNEKVNFDGVIITKLDGDTRGGIALSILYTIGKPVKFVGVGEKIDDLEPFIAQRMASRILGMGDILTLIEKAKDNVKIKDIENLGKKIKKNSFDMDDLLSQMKQIKKLGSIKNIINMIPGVAGKIKDEELEKGKDKLVKVESIINSMTKKEKQTPSIINYSRKKRIASGSGTSIFDVNQLLKQFEQMQKIFKKIGGKKMPFKNIPFLKFN